MKTLLTAAVHAGEHIPWMLTQLCSLQGSRVEHPGLGNSEVVQRHQGGLVHMEHETRREPP